MRFLKIFILCFLFSIFFIGCDNADSTNSSAHDHVHDHEHEHVEGYEQVSDEDALLIEKANREWQKKLELGECKDVEFKTDSFVTICNQQATFENVEELKKKFPNIPNIDLKLDYEIKQIYVSIEPESAKLEKFKSWNNFTSFVIDLNKEGNSIVLSYIPVEPTLDTNTVNVKEETYNNKDYKIISNKAENQYNGIYSKVSISDKDYYLVASNSNSEGKTYINENEFLDLFNSNFQLLFE